VWVDDTPGNFDILYRRSTNGGASFGATDNLSNNVGLSFEPSVAASGNNVYVGWRDSTPGNFDILYRRSVDGGANFDPAVNLSNDAGQSFFPALTASGNNVYAVWQDNEVWYRRSVDGGANFDPAINLSNNVGFSAFPAVAALGNNVYVVWQDQTLGDDEILYRKSADGVIFDPTINLSNNAGVSASPAIAYYDTQL
jgi:hypothetical protein